MSKEEGELTVNLIWARLPAEPLFISLADSVEQRGLCVTERLETQKQVQAVRFSAQVSVLVPLLLGLARVWDWVELEGKHGRVDCDFFLIEPPQGGVHFESSWESFQL